jgi:transcriptional regulator with XRE-family HTH domain
MDDISKILLSIRKKVGLTQQGFAGRIGLKQNTYSMLESGKNKPKIETIYTIIKEFELDANIFFEKFGPGFISDSIDVIPIKNDNDKRADEVISSKELDEMIKYKLNYMDFYLLGISYHVRTLQEKMLNIKFDESHYIVEENYIKSIRGNVIENVPPKYISLSISEKIDLVKELDEATRQYLDNIWVISSKLLISL